MKKGRYRKRIAYDLLGKEKHACTQPCMYVCATYVHIHTCVHMCALNSIYFWKDTVETGCLQRGGTEQLEGRRDAYFSWPRFLYTLNFVL